MILLVDKGKMELIYLFLIMVNYLNATIDVLHAMNMVILADIIAYHVEILVYIFWANMMKINQKVIA